MIRNAEFSEIENILNITQACARNLISKNIHQWHANYPNKTIIEQDITSHNLYVLELNGRLIGCVTLSSKLDAVYKTVSWLTPNYNNLYVHRLAVHPDFQGQGWAQKLMNFAENYAQKHQFTSIRLDTFSKNIKNQKFYELRGYKKLGSIFFPKQSEHPFYCYEFVL
ncbi:GNAT family N-acetyltransferase [Bizionia sediminis]|uniref:GNAT family N-acetyltransferase n=1 Tax=Bizionia sediminis TaxID=1737064 RepID=A0ABW5KSV8_9FLAO